MAKNHEEDDHSGVEGKTTEIKQALTETSDIIVNKTKGRNNLGGEEW